MARSGVAYGSVSTAVVSPVSVSSVQSVRSASVKRTCVLSGDQESS